MTSFWQELELGLPGDAAAAADPEGVAGHDRDVPWTWTHPDPLLRSSKMGDPRLQIGDRCDHISIYGSECLLVSLQHNGKLCFHNFQKIIFTISKRKFLRIIFRNFEKKDWIIWKFEIPNFKAH